MATTERNPLDRPVSALAKVHPNTTRALAAIGVRTVRDVMLHFPSRHEQLAQEGEELAAGSTCSITATVVKSGYRKAFRRGLSVVEATLATSTGQRQAVWFNQPYVAKRLVPGASFRFTGKLTVARGGVKLVNPFMEPATAPQQQAVYGGNELVPVYPATVGLSQHSIRRLVSAARPLMRTLPDPLPPALREKYQLLPYAEAVERLHFPADLADADVARKRLGFDEVLALQLALARLRDRRAHVAAPAMAFPEDEVRAFVAGLPFELTDDQRRAAWDIIRDLERPLPMQRLLNGDVGTGKTAVAAVAAFVTARNGLQTAVMAPTEILAQQHARTLGQLFAGTSVRVVVWTSAYKFEVRTSTAKKKPAVTTSSKLSKKEVEALRQEIADGKVGIVVGTHALVQPEFAFGNLGLAVVDEQHRFGVATRQALLERGVGGKLAPHFLSMTATPIPRSLALTAYGDLDVSVLRQRPKSRPPVTTVLVPERPDAAWAEVRAELESGRQAFVVCPLVEETEGREDADVATTAERLAGGELRGWRIACLHGRMKPADKEAAMGAFSAGETNVLVCTSVVEVGVDVPNATVMWIEGAERFGLSQLHQFRGRVGRGSHAAVCYLAPRQRGESARARLKAMVETSDGFTLAERDLSLRGHGDLLGETQSGLPTFRVASIADTELTAAAREAAKELIVADPTLRSCPDLRKAVDALARDAHGE